MLVRQRPPVAVTNLQSPKMSTIKAAIEDLFDPRLPVEEAVDRHFAPSFRQRVDGTWGDRAWFLANVAELREAFEAATVEVLDELVDGRRYAERHVMSLMSRDGERSRREVFIFGERDDDGRFVRIEEVVLPLAAPGAP